jgi:hypothetical protein
VCNTSARGHMHVHLATAAEAKKDFKDVFMVYEYHEIPAFLQINKYIKTGYRKYLSYT